jgi:hypothetical protein
VHVIPCRCRTVIGNYGPQHVTLYTCSSILAQMALEKESSGGARWSSGQCARRAIAEAKQRSQRPVLGWVTKIFYLEVLRASEVTLSRWSRLHLQSLVLQFQGGLTSGRRSVVKIIAESLSQHNEKHVVSTPLSGIRVGGRRGLGKRVVQSPKCTV